MSYSPTGILGIRGMEMIIVKQILMNKKYGVIAGWSAYASTFERFALFTSWLHRKSCCILNGCVLLIIMIFFACNGGAGIERCKWFCLLAILELEFSVVTIKHVIVFLSTSWMSSS